MDAEQKKRLKAIKARKNKREKQRKKVMRCILGVAAILIIVIIIAAVKGCHKNKNENPTVTVTQAPTATPVSRVSRDIDQKFFTDSCFFGNSFIGDMEQYDLIDGADYFWKVGLSVNDAETESAQDGNVPIIEELNTNRNYKKIFFMFGENELGWENKDKFVSQYKKLIDKAKKYQPDAQIFLMAVTPVSSKVSEESTDGTTNENIKKINGLIKELADKTETVYCDTFDAVANSKGVLPESAATDGIHFEKSYYEKCLIYIQKHYSEEELAKDTETQAPDESSSSDNSSNSGGSSSNSGSGSSNSGSGSSNSGSSSSNSGGSSSSSSSSGRSSSSGSSSSGSSSASGSSSSGRSSSSGSSSSGRSSSSGSSSSGSSSASSSSSSGNNSSSSNSSGSNSSSSGSSSKAEKIDLDDAPSSNGGAEKKDID